MKSLELGSSRVALRLRISLKMPLRKSALQSSSLDVFCAWLICPTSHSIVSAAISNPLASSRQILLALDALDRRKPQERVRRLRYGEDAGDQNNAPAL